MRIAVTGVTGTFGNAFVRNVLGQGRADRVVGVSRDELKQAEMAERFAELPGLRLFLGDVRDERRLVEAFYGCDAVVHAAALKRVDAVAYNPSEVVKTNVAGTENVVRAALAAGVARVVVVSSDKAVAPTNIYGVSKAMAEQIAVNANSYTAPQGMRVSVVRYGNVLGSRGSVVHLWRRQVARGQPITITDRRMARFVLTVEQGVGHVLAALDAMEGGEIFVPKLPSAWLESLAVAVGRGWPTRETGLRTGGEKLAEELLSLEESTRTLVGDDCLFVVTPHLHSWRSDGWVGERLPEGSRYVSNGSFGWLTEEDLVDMLKDVPTSW